MHLPFFSGFSEASIAHMHDIPHVQRGSFRKLQASKCTVQLLHRHAMVLSASKRQWGCEEMCVFVTCHEQYHDWRALCFIRKRNPSEKLNFLFIFWTWIWKRTITQFMGFIHKDHLQSRDSLGEKPKTV